MEDKKYKTDFLIPEKSYLTGIESILNIAGGATFHSSESGEEADRKAIESDWGMIGQDFKSAMIQLCNE